MGRRLNHKTHRFWGDKTAASHPEWRNGVQLKDRRVSLRRNVRPAFSSTPANGGCQPTETSVCVVVHVKVFVSVGSRRTARLLGRPPDLPHDPHPHLVLVLVLVLVLGVSASSLDLRCATPILSQKIPPVAGELRSNAMRAAKQRSQQFGSPFRARAFG